jgi:hypothetical protein
MSWPKSLVKQDRALFASFCRIVCEVKSWQCGVPEPATLGLLALGGLALIRRRRVA